MMSQRGRHSHVTVARALGREAPASAEFIPSLHSSPPACLDVLRMSIVRIGIILLYVNIPGHIVRLFAK